MLEVTESTVQAIEQPRFNWRAIAPLIAAEAVSATGSWMTIVALPWFVLTTTGSPAQMSWALAADLAPMALLGVPAGSLAQRLKTRRTMLICDAARAVLVALIPSLHLLGLLSFPVLLGLVFTSGTFFTPHFSAQQAALPELLGERMGEVSGAAALLQGTNRFAAILGPVAAGALMAVVNPAEVLFVDGATYLIAFAVLLAFLPSRKAAVPATESDRSLLAGLRFLAGDTLLRGIVTAGALGECAYQSLFVAIPALVAARYGLHPELAGALVGAWGAGAVGSSLATGRLARHYPPLALIRVAVLGQALPLWLLAVRAPVIGLGAALFVAGVANPLSSGPTSAVRLLRTPAQLRSAVTATWLTLLTSAATAGLAVAGLAIEALGVTAVLLGIAALASVRAAVMWVVIWRSGSMGFGSTVSG